MDWEADSMAQNSKPEERRPRYANIDQGDVERMMLDKRKNDERIKRKAAKQGKRNR
jgi:hypothetical protein